MKADYRYLRPAKATSLKGWLESGFCRKEKLEYYCYKNASILPIKKLLEDGLQFGRGGVIDQNNVYQVTSGIDGRVGGYYDHSLSEYEDKCVVYCGYLVKQWGHFLVEGVARLWYFLENDSAIDKYVFITEENGSCQAKGNFGEFLRLLGIADKVEIINRPVKYRDVIVPELGYKRKEYYSDQYKRVFDVVATNAIKEYSINEKVSGKIYLSRGRFRKALQAETGLDMLDDYFARNGFELLYPEKTSLSEMICCIRNADICAAESGTVPHNMLFARDEQKLVIIERQSIVTEIQADIDRIKDLDVTYIDGHYTIYPVSAGYGPYMLAFNRWLKQYSLDHGYLPPAEEYLSENYLRTCFQQYMHVYRQAYGYRWGMEAWQLQYAEALFEAYEESCEVFKSYLEMTKPFTWKQRFSWHYIKQKLHQIKAKSSRKE